MVSTTCENPCTSTDFECRLRNPESGCYGELGHWLRFDTLYLTCDKTEAVAEVNYCGLDTLTGLGCEDKTGCLLLADTDTEEVYLKCGFVNSNERTYLKHVALER